MCAMTLLRPIPSRLFLVRANARSAVIRIYKTNLHFSILLNDRVLQIVIHSRSYLACGCNRPQRSNFFRQRGWQRMVCGYSKVRGPSLTKDSNSCTIKGFGSGDDKALTGPVLLPRLRRSDGNLKEKRTRPYLDTCPPYLVASWP
jgi:hypothetical protein